MCYATVQREVANRLYDKLHEDRPWHDGTETFWAKEFSRRTPFHARDGVTIWVSRSDLTPDDDFLSQKELDLAVALAAGGEADDEEHEPED